MLDERLWQPLADVAFAARASAAQRVEPIEARVTGSPGLTELRERDAVALMPVGYPPFDGVVQVALADDVTLPLLVLWPTGVPSAAVRRVREGMTSAG